MAVTKFKGPVNSVDGFQFNGRACSIGATRIITTAGSASEALDCGVAGLTTMIYGFGEEVTQAASKTLVAVQPYASAASFQYRLYFSSDATVRNVDGDNQAATVDIILIGTA